MVGDTCGVDAGGVGPSHQGLDSLLRTETGVEDDGTGLRGAVLGVPGGWRPLAGPCRPPWLWRLRRVALDRGVRRREGVLRRCRTSGRSADEWHHGGDRARFAAHRSVDPRYTAQYRVSRAPDSNIPDLKGVFHS